MNALGDRDGIEGRYGPLGSGAQSLAIRGMTYSLPQLLAQIGAEFDDSKPIDALALPEGRYVLRYIDGQDLRVVASEFDADFECSARHERASHSGMATAPTSPTTADTKLIRQDLRALGAVSWRSLR